MKDLRKICHHLQEEIDKTINSLLSECKKEYTSDNIKGYVTDTVRGKAHFNGQFTVPLWAYSEKRPGYFVYYVAHELAHQLRYKEYGFDGSHDFRFYEIFMDICPKDFQKYELEYKKTSSKYGIK